MAHGTSLNYFLNYNPEFVLQVCGNWKWVITSFERFPLLPFADLTTLFGSFTFITTNWLRSQLNRSWYSRNSLCWICQVSIPFYPDTYAVCVYVLTHWYYELTPGCQTWQKVLHKTWPFLSGVVGFSLGGILFFFAWLKSGAAAGGAVIKLTSHKAKTWLMLAGHRLFYGGNAIRISWGYHDGLGIESTT